MSHMLDRILSSQALAGRVRRYHAYPSVYTQSVGEHSHRVITLYIELFGIPRVEVLVYIAYHDLGELYGGDSPFGAKRDIPELKEAINHAEEIGLQKLGIKLPDITTEEWIQFKAADLLEMLEYATLEHQQGNLFALPIIGNIEKGILALTKDNPVLKQKLVNWMDDKKMEYYD